MRLSVINTKFERVIERSFAQLLLSKGYERHANQFYFKAERIGKLITIDRDCDHTYYRQVAIFTIRVAVLSDDVWAMYHPGQAIPIFPFQRVYGHEVFARNLGQFYGKRRGDQWLALDATVPEEWMIHYLDDLLRTRILPHLDRFSLVDDILKEYGRYGASHLRMRLLAHLERVDEARLELKKLLASRHQLGFRLNMIKLAQQLGLI